MSKEKFAIDNISFGNALQNFRKAQNLTLAALAKTLGTSAGYLSEVERGMKKPGTDLLFSLKCEFNVDINALLEGAVSFLPANSVKEPSIDYPSQSEKDALSNLAAQIILNVESSSISSSSKIEITESILRMINKRIEK